MKRTHGLSQTRQYKIWKNMKNRCSNKNIPKYLSYGARGITYDNSWNIFENFWNDMKDGYADHLELDRIDPTGNYCKNNCRWLNESEQAFNCFLNKKKDKFARVGIGFHKGTGKWRARISKENVTYELGVFKSYEEACKAREDAEIKYYGYNLILQDNTTEEKE